MKRIRALGYCRVSTAGQADDGVSLDDQRHRITAYADLHDLELVGFEIDAGASGKTTRRPAFQRALRRLGSGEVHGLIFLKLDRASRSVIDVLRLVERAEREGWALHSIRERLDTSSAVGRFTVTLLAALAELERRQTSERTKSALGELRRQGKRTSGRPPFGYRHGPGGHLVPVPAEADIIARMMALREAGAGARRIARALNDEGRPNPRTRDPWTHGTVQHVIRRLERERAEGSTSGSRTG